MPNKAKRYSLAEIASKLELDLQLKSGSQAADSIFVEGIGSLIGASSVEITFLADSRYQTQLSSSKALAVILQPSMAAECKTHCLLSDDPYLSYAKLTQLFSNRVQDSIGVHASAVVDSSALLGENVRIAAGVIIGQGVVIGDGSEIKSNAVVEANVIIGKRAKIHSNVTLCQGVSLGDDVTIQSGTVIGSEGFGYVPFQQSSGSDSELRWQPIAQLGTVVIGDRVEIGASTTIDRGALENTIIESDVIIDNQVHVAHNVSVGQSTAIAGCVGIAGSTKIGKRCSFAGIVGVAGHISIADDSTFLGMTRVNRSIKKPGIYASGTSMQEAAVWRKNAVRFSQLDSLTKRLQQLEKQLAAVTMSKNNSE